MKEVAPVVVFCYNRPDHLTRTLNALAKNELAADSDLFIYCDGAKEGALPEQRAKVSSTREVAYSASGFKSVTVVERQNNCGLAVNIVTAVTEIVNAYGRIITLEDDIVTSKGFLRFMNDALNMYESDEMIMHISAYMWPHRALLPSTFFYPVPYPGGGWATWARAWKHYDDDADKLYDRWAGRWQEFDLFGGDYLSKQLIANHNRTLKTWFIKWYAVMLDRKALTLYPGKSLTNNIGFDDQSTNCYATTKFDIEHPAEHVKVVRKKVVVNKVASREIYAFYQGRWYNKRRRTETMKRIKKLLRLW